MKKIISCLLAVLMLSGILTACSNTPSKEKKEKLSVVCTIFPEYDWVTQILGSHSDETEITMLLDNGVDLHSYQPTADDIIKVATCDLFIYVGGESDEWVEDALKEATNKNMVVINLLEVLGDKVKEEEVKEGMETEEEEGGEEEEGPEYDEHVWLSLKNASVFCEEISEKISALDSGNSEYYKTNSEKYIAKLKDLDKEYQTSIDSAKQKTVLFGDRFPFRYLVEDYGLDYYAAFLGCSAETETSFETIAFLAGKVDEIGLSSVMTIEGAQHKIAQTVIQNTKEKNQQILVMDSIQSTTSKDVDNGTTYLSIMSKNLNTLKTELN